MSAKGKLRIAGGPTQALAAYCPACDDFHVIPTAGPEPTWVFDGNYRNPTFNPSIIVKYTTDEGRVTHICHANILEGQWVYHSDSTHDYKNQALPMREEHDNG